MACRVSFIGKQCRYGEPAMPPRTPRLLCYALLTLCLIGSISLWGISARPVYSGITAHEWGTFTSVAGHDGQAVQWSPLTGSTDLPGFVEQFQKGGYKLGLRGTVRMETPVLYFYSPAEQTVSVKVDFSKGVITEWYPHASRVEPRVALHDLTLYQNQPDGSVAWDAVTLSPSLPADFPQGTGSDRYFAARATTSTPLRVQTPAGEQREKFLFYRGVSVFSVPISATVTPAGEVLAENRGTYTIPSVILFERRGTEVGYRIANALENEASLDPPELTASIDSLARELEGILISQGLFQNEAQAMVQTWRDSWFEEGTRLLYIVPREFVDSVLPLSIKPAPIQTTRVFVGRLELVTPATEDAVANAFAARDRAKLAKYARFLEPILKTMIENTPNLDKTKEFRDDLNLYYNSQFR
jgi:hypothetical protein